MTDKYNEAVASFNALADTIAEQWDTVQLAEGNFCCAFCGKQDGSMRKVKDGTIICEYCAPAIMYELDRRDSSFLEDVPRRAGPPDDLEEARANLKKSGGPKQYRNTCLFRNRLANVINTTNKISTSLALLNSENPCDCCNNVKGFYLMSDQEVPIDGTETTGYKFSVPLKDCELNVCNNCQYQAVSEADKAISPFTFVSKRTKFFLDQKRATKTQN